MQMTVKTQQGDDVSRHVRVFSRVQRITELIVHIFDTGDKPIVRASIKRTNVPNERRKMIDGLFEQEVEKLCGLFSVTSHDLRTDAVEHQTLWLPIEK